MLLQRVLIPLDGSKVGEAALPVIEDLIPKLLPETKVEITLLGVITQLRHWVVVGEASAPISYTEDELKGIEQKEKDYLEQTGEILRSQGVVVNAQVATGNAAEEILKMADEISADMIAMSTHGRSGLSRLAFGSVTDKVLRGAGMPVLMVRAPAGTDNVELSDQCGQSEGQVCSVVISVARAPKTPFWLHWYFKYSSAFLVSLAILAFSHCFNRYLNSQ